MDFKSTCLHGFGEHLPPTWAQFWRWIYCLLFVSNLTITKLSTETLNAWEIWLSVWEKLAVLIGVVGDVERLEDLGFGLTPHHSSSVAWRIPFSGLNVVIKHFSKTARTISPAFPDILDSSWLSIYGKAILGTTDSLFSGPIFHVVKIVLQCCLNGRKNATSCGWVELGGNNIILMPFSVHVLTDVREKCDDWLLLMKILEPSRLRKFGTITFLSQCSKHLDNLRLKRVALDPL